MDDRAFGRSGLLVSPLRLGTMTFGNPDWGLPDDVSEQLFKAYLDGGGNVIESADVSCGERSGELVPSGGGA